MATPILAAAVRVFLNLIRGVRFLIAAFFSLRTFSRNDVAPRRAGAFRRCPKD